MPCLLFASGRWWGKLAGAAVRSAQVINGTGHLDLLEQQGLVHHAFDQVAQAVLVGQLAIGVALNLVLDTPDVADARLGARVLLSTASDMTI